jgi:hypothetical protein
VAQEAVTLQLSIRESGKRMQQVLNHDYNMSLSLSWCRKSTKDAFDTGKIVSPQKPCGVYIPSNLEVRIVSAIKRGRQQKLHVSPHDVMSWATHLIRDTEHENNFVNGHAMIIVANSTKCWSTMCPPYSYNIRNGEPQSERSSG